MLLTVKKHKEPSNPVKFFLQQTQFKIQTKTLKFTHYKVEYNNSIKHIPVINTGGTHLARSGIGKYQWDKVKELIFHLRQIFVIHIENMVISNLTVNRATSHYWYSVQY